MKPYYQDQWAAIYHGDAREFGFLKADVLITDPPYGINVGKNQSSKETRRGLLVKSSYIGYADTPENYESIVVPAIKMWLKQTKRACVFGFPPNIWKLPPPATIGGIYTPAGCGRSAWGFTGFMPVLLYGCVPNLQFGAKPTCFYSTATAEKSDHPTPKPLEWMKWLVSLATDDSDVVIDPFMGSGTTLRAAKDLERKSIGIELEERYCEIAAQRLSQEVLPLNEPPPCQLSQMLIAT